MIRLFNRLKSWGLRVIAVLVWIGMIGLIFVLTVELWGAITSPAWQTTQGNVIKNDDKLHYRYGGGGRYWIDFVYQYEVNNEAYTARRLWFFEMINTPTKEELQTVLDTYLQASPITVTYSPRFPQQAVIFSQVETREWGSVITAGFCIIPGFAFLFVLTLLLWDYGKILKKNF